MNKSHLQKVTLAIAGLTALAVGAFILIAPNAFYASYGISLIDNTNLLSELRAPAANLSIMGIIMLIGIVRSSWIQISATLAMIVFLAFPAGRIISLLVDGIPSNGILTALAVELAIGALCITAFWCQLDQRTANHTRYMGDQI